MKDVLLSARDVAKQFPGAAHDFVLDHLSLELYRGDFTIIMGPSGAGKSTLLYALSGMDSVSNGVVAYKGQELRCLSEKQMSALRAMEFGFVFQQPHLVSNLTLFENVAVAGYLDKDRSGPETDRRAEQLLAQMHLEDAKNCLTAQASGGEAQRAAIARAVINGPGLLFADEPIGALNRKNSEEVLDILTALKQQGQSILMVTHDLRAAVRGTRIFYLEDGKILDELRLPPYDASEARIREEQVSAWLTALSW